MNAPRYDILTLFPEALDAFLSTGLFGKARERGVFSARAVQIRDFAFNRYRQVDDAPYGGGEGMVLRADVLAEAIKQVLPQRQLHQKKDDSRVILLSPQGQLFDQKKARELTQFEHLVLVCGHYEGVDERWIEHYVDEEISIGDYVLMGGELPALVVLETVVRLLPGVVGNPQSIAHDSLEGGLLKYPQYTRPAEFEGESVPSVLLSGHHEQIAKWRDQQRIERTKLKRPDLFKKIRK